MQSTPDLLDASGEERDDRKAVERLCAVTRAVLPVDELIRFVRAPDGTVTPDIQRRLPGRGVWVTARRDHVTEAVRKKVFARSFKAQVTVPEGLTEQVEALLARSALDMLSMANKAGCVTSGFMKVVSAVENGTAVAIYHASDGAEDGLRKLMIAAKKRGGQAPPVMKVFTSTQMDLALGRTNVIHAAMLTGGVSAAAVARADLLTRYRAENVCSAASEPPAEMDVE